MAADRPNGFIPFGHLTGGVPRLSQVKYTFATGYATSIFRGDMVQLVTAGTIARAAAGGTGLLGAFWGVRYVDAQGNQVFSNMWTASTAATDIEALIYDDPFIIYRAQADSGGTNLTQAAVGTNTDILATAGNTRTGMSAEEVDQSEIGTAAAQVRILGRVDEPDNDWGDHTDLLVMINEGIMPPLTTTGI